MDTTLVPRIEARLEYEAGSRFRVSFPGGAPSIHTDAAPPLGDSTGPDPVELLAAAVGNCLASSFMFCVRKARLEPEGLAVEVEVIRERDEQGRMRVGRMRARLVPRLSEADRARVGRCLELFESYCVVAESVRAGIPIDVDVEPLTTSRAPQRARRAAPGNGNALA